MENKKKRDDDDDQVSEILITIDDHLHKQQQQQQQQQQQGKKKNSPMFLNPANGPGSHLKPPYKPLRICRVPSNLRELQSQAFDPKLVSVGPFHRGNEQLKPMEGHKWRFLSRLLNSMDHHHHGHDRYQNDVSSIFLADAAELMDSASSSATAVTQQQYELIVANAIKLRPLINAMKELESSTRSSYADDKILDHFGSNEFILMMLLDGCFIVELLRLYSAKCDEENVDDPIFSWYWTVPILQHDLLMLENQLPFTVLEKIFKITSPRREHYSLTDLTLKFFDALLPRDHIRNILSKFTADDSSKPHHHLLGLFRYSFLSPFILVKKSLSSVQQAGSETMIDDIAALLPGQETGSLVACATELNAAGIVLKKREKHELLDIEFKKGKLYIPPLLIDYHSVCVLLNFFAYEQCNQCLEPSFTQYFLFFSNLLNSSKDVEHLCSKGIIRHVWDRNEDVANLFHRFHKEVVAGNIHQYGFLSVLLKDMYWYSCRKSCRRRANFMADYKEWKHANFRSPWAFLSFVAAILLLAFTAIQTFFSVFSYLRHP